MFGVIHVPRLRWQPKPLSQVDAVGEVNLDIIHGSVRVTAQFLNMPGGDAVHLIQAIQGTPQGQQCLFGLDAEPLPGELRAMWALTSS